ncbi:hypothetical protein C8R44DRAFT_735113 [Mycena epipterygia]|nr:hypothetical protein C8R44DRAFT_735113 [Mycena epipterygia]
MTRVREPTVVIVGVAVPYRHEDPENKFAGWIQEAQLPLAPVPGRRRLTKVFSGDILDFLTHKIYGYGHAGTTGLPEAESGEIPLTEVLDYHSGIHFEALKRLRLALGSDSARILSEYSLPAYYFPKTAPRSPALNVLVNLPVELIHEIYSHLDEVGDVLYLSITSQVLWEIGRNISIATQRHSQPVIPGPATASSASEIISSTTTYPKHF